MNAEWINEFDRLIRQAGIEAPDEAILFGTNAVVLLIGWLISSLAYRWTGRTLVQWNADRILSLPDGAEGASSTESLTDSSPDATPASEDAVVPKMPVIPRWGANAARFAMLGLTICVMLDLNGFAATAETGRAFLFRAVACLCAAYFVFSYAHLVTKIILDIAELRPPTGKPPVSDANVLPVASSDASTDATPRPAALKPVPRALAKGVMLGIYSVAAVPLLVFAAELFQSAALIGVFGGLWRLLIRLATAACLMGAGRILLQWHRGAAGEEDSSAKSVERVGYIVLAILALGVIVGDASALPVFPSFSGWFSVLLLLGIAFVAYRYREILTDVAYGIALGSKPIHFVNSRKRRYRIAKVGWTTTTVRTVDEEVSTAKQVANRRVWHWHRQKYDPVPAAGAATPTTPEGTSADEPSTVPTLRPRLAVDIPPYDDDDDDDAVPVDPESRMSME